MARKPLNTSIVNDTTVNNMVPMGRAKLQAYSGSNWVTTPATIVAGTTQFTSAGFFVRPGKRFILQSLILTANGECEITAFVSPDAAGTWHPWVVPYAGNSDTLVGIKRLMASFGPNGGSVEIPMGGGYILYENMAMTLSYKSPNTVGKNISFIAVGAELPNEPNTNADFKIMVVGDSNGQMNNLGNDAVGRAFLGNTHFSEVFRDLARQNDIDAQIFANNSEDGKTMLEGYYMIEQGLNKVPFDLQFVIFGMNDATSQKYPTEAKFKEAAKAHIIARNKFNKNKPIVFIGVPATDDPDRTGSSRVSNIRQWTLDVATDATIGGTSRNVYYFDASQLIPLNAVQANDLNYKSQERVGGQYRVHYSGTGSTLLGNLLWDNLKSPLFNK